MLSGCGSDEPSPLDEPAAPTADTDSDDEAEVVDLAERYWRAVVRSENEVDDDPEQFSDVAQGGFIEGQLKEIRDYEAAGIRRVGEPALTEIEAMVTGDTAEIWLCLDEDEWTAEQGGQTIEAPELGPRPWGAQAELREDEWTVVGIGRPEGDDTSCD